MAKLLMEWINEDVGLSQSVISMDNDFYDGYLLGELLFKYNQQHNFAEFAYNADAEGTL